MSPMFLTMAALLVLVTTIGVLPADEPNRREPIKLSPELRERCLETLRKALKSDEFWPAMHAAEALTLAGRGDEVQPALRDRLPTEKDDQRRCGLARELVRSGERKPLPILFDILADTKSNGRIHAVECFYKLANVGDGKLVRAAFAQTENSPLQLWAAAALARTGDKDALALLRKKLRSDDRAARNTCAYVLSVLGSEADIESLTLTFEKETDATAKAILASALACLGDAKGRTELGRNLDSTDPGIRSLSADFAGQGRCVEFQAKLIQLLDDANLDARVRAAQSLLVLSAPAAK